jgi:hypothetical protein
MMNSPSSPPSSHSRKRVARNRVHREFHRETKHERFSTTLSVSVEAARRQVPRRSVDYASLAELRDEVSISNSRRRLLG